MSEIELIQLLLIVIVIGLPPYLSAIGMFKKLPPFVFAIASLVYWGGTLYTQQIVPFLLIIILLIKSHRDRKQQGEIQLYTSHQPFRVRDFFSTIVFTILIRYPIAIINVFYVYFINRLGIEMQQQEIIDVFVNSQNSVLNILLICLVVIVAPINEEFSMRHWFFGRVLSPTIGPIFAAIISSALFTLLHYNITGVPTFFLLGLYACYIYHRKGLWGAVTVHFTFNLTSILAVIWMKYFLPITIGI